MCLVWERYSPAAIVNARWSWRPPPRLEAMDAAFDLRMQFMSLSDSLVGSLKILVIFGVRKSVRTLSILLVDPAMTLHASVLRAFVSFPIVTISLVC